MVLNGHVQNGVVVPDPPAALPEGALVRIEVLPAASTQGEISTPRPGGQWKGKVSLSGDFDTLPDDLAEAFGLRAP